MAFNIKIPLPTPEQAFNFLAWQVRRLDWFLANNRANRLAFFQNLNHSVVNDMITEKNRRLSQTDFYEKYFSPFANRMYRKEEYAPLIEYTLKAVEKLQSCFLKYQDLQKSWGFQILPEYHIDINRYGSGGSYRRDEHHVGHIITGVNPENPPELFARLLGHEILHLGIEDLLINPQHKKEAPVRQEEKERIVDNLCIYAMDGVLPLGRRWTDKKVCKYQEVAKEASYMDAVVGCQPENNLLESVSQFLRKNKR